MEYSSKINGEVLELSLSGDLIGEDIGLDIVELVNSSIENKSLYGVIDISNLRYINSSGIGVLITVLTKFRNKGGEVYLVNPSESVQKLLIITKLNAIFTVVDTSEDAYELIHNN
jgi:anti-sigma B factor antagonist